MTTLPVRDMVLYKHGVGFFVREGTINAETITLTFRQTEINDVLKSLTVFDRAGGQVLGIHYPTPMDKNARLADSSIKLSEQTSLRDLIRDLRGRNASLTFEITPGSHEMVTGRILGIDHQPVRTLPSTTPIESSLVSVLTDDGQINVFPFDKLRTITIRDERSAYDLNYFLDTSMGMENHRSVTLRLSEGNHNLVVHYVAPSPTWRVSYRLIAESDKGDETGKALLQGWGLFDNRLEEDLENVRVTLVAGQPISFIYELYASHIPQRPTVQDEVRIAPGPVEFDATADLPDWLQSTEDESTTLKEPRILMKRAAMPAAAPAPQKMTIPMSREEAAQSVKPTIETKSAGEFFQYIVSTPVSVKRGESALVPIIGSEISYVRELLYNKAKLPDHPVASLRFTNSTGLTLERGPVTVVENNDYRGEAVVPFTKDGNEVYLPYAVELGITITERETRRTVTTGLGFQETYVVYEEYEVVSTTYVIENTTDKPQTITIESPIQTDFELYETRAADVETARERRWKVSVPGHHKTEFVRKERRLTQRYEYLRNLNFQQLQNFLKHRWLDDATFNQLSELLKNVALIQQMQTNIGQIEQERRALYQKQEQLRANLQALNPSGQEAALRSRVLGQLEVSQDRLEAIEKQQTENNDQITKAETQIAQIMAGLPQQKT